MAQTLAQKLKIKEDYVLRTLHAPPHFAGHIGPLPEGVHLSVRSNRFDQLHWFVTSQLELESELPGIQALLADGAVCWIYYPKGTSKVPTDLGRDKLHAVLQQYPDWQMLSLISFDDTWSAFGFRKKAVAVRRSPPPKARPIEDYIDPVKKEVRIPEDLAAAFQQAKEAGAAFERLAFSHRKEYVEWIVEAKRDETRQNRVAGTIERLQKGWKNPRNL